VTFEFVLHTSADDEAAPAAVLAALAQLGGLRRAIDYAERDLIDTARRRGVGWGEIARALGLRSRQAAEQRRLRLVGPDRRDPSPVREHRHGQRIVDRLAGEAIVRLRNATVAALRQLDRDPDWDTRDARAALVRSSLRTAASAPPGVLYSLVEQAIADLNAFTTPAPPTPALTELRMRWTAATPA
jgi:hypothetical protein